jgi:DNA-binding transcriptional MocR family regulator
MTDYARFLSRAAGHMQESAIRRMGMVLAQGRDIISFAPGYPAPETFPWKEFRDITNELLSGAATAPCSKPSSASWSTAARARRCSSSW